MIYCPTAQAGNAVNSQRKRRKKRGSAVKQDVVMWMIHCLTAQVVGSVVNSQRKRKKRGSLKVFRGSAVKMMRRRKKRGSAMKQDVVMWMIHCLTAQVVGSAVNSQRKRKKRGSLKVFRRSAVKMMHCPTAQEGSAVHR